ncbi:MAG: formylglycine-generating enzyme family protein, partial [Candidatus Latescibacterota bacterium]
KTIKNLSANLTQNFDAKLPSYTLSGTVTGADSVTVTLSGGSSATWMVNKSGGTYSFTVAAFGTFTITPTKKGYVFTPPNKKVENLSANLTQNFDAKPLFTLSGTINGADGVTVTLSGDATGIQTVYNGGSYSFSVEPGGNYTVTPSKVAYDFTPTNKTFTTVSSSVMQDFTAKFNYESLGIVMKTIPAGSFRMGQSDISNAVPVHTVTLTAFSMSIFEVTQGQFKAIMGTNSSKFTGDDNLPVEMVTWFDAIKYCNILSVSVGLQSCYNESTGMCDFTKNGFRLPTEAEWEYSCRAGTETIYNLGNSESDLARAAWYGSNSGGNTHPVGQKTANEWGLYDMHGNVWEFCNDWYSESYYSSSPSVDPTGSSTGSDRVMRGGGYFGVNKVYQSAYRGPGGQNGRYDFLGFRVVCRP